LLGFSVGQLEIHPIQEEQCFAEISPILLFCCCLNLARYTSKEESDRCSRVCRCTKANVISGLKKVEENTQWVN